VPVRADGQKTAVVKRLVKVTVNRCGICMSQRPGHHA